MELLQRDFSGEHYIYTRDPGGTALGMWMRALLQHGDSMSDETELLLFLASRAQLVYETIMPNLEKGTHVISNRFDLSTYAYQIYGRQRLGMKDFVEQVSEYARGGAMPDAVVLLDAPVELALGRLQARGETITRFEAEKIEFHERVREGYLTYAKTYPNVHVIDASPAVEAVYAHVKAVITQMLG